MKFELKNFLISTSGWISLLSVSFFFVVLNIFIKDGVQQPFKETLTLTLSFLSALATIGAAIIAARIFQTWKTQHSYIEQCKYLGEMVQTVNDLLSAITDARQNENLKDIFLGYRSKLPMAEAFADQIKRSELLDIFITDLRRLENQIYLLNNIKEVDRVFSEKERGNISFDKVVDLIADIQGNINSINDILSINYGNGSYVISNLKLGEPIIQEMILKSSLEGDRLLREVIPDKFTLNHNLENDEIINCLNELNQCILNYKERLDMES